MSQVTHPAAYLQIEDTIDALGQKYRAQRIVRGAMWFVGCALGLSIALAFAAHFTGASLWTRVMLAVWGAWMLVSAWWWLARPLLISPDPIQVARLIEERVGGLHNGLTNSLLLARRSDIANSPWLPAIFEEIAHRAGGQPLGDAVRMRDLKVDARKLLLGVGPLLLLAACLPGTMFHGLQQMFHPSAFVPHIGSATILDVQPRDVTLVTGQSLEITIQARAPGMPPARLIFERAPGASAISSSANIPPTSELMAAAMGNAGAGDIQYNYRADHIDTPLRYRVEVAGTQSPWYSVTLVQEIKLTALELKISPPLYTQLPEQSLTIKPDELRSKPIVVPQGSQVQIAATVDVPAGGALLQAGANAPLPMEASAQGQHFMGSVLVIDETNVSVLLTAGGHQILARIPEDGLAIHCAKDNPPIIEMKWPNQDLDSSPQAELKLSALLRDDYGLTSARVLLGADDSSGESSRTNKIPADAAETQPSAPSMDVVQERKFDPGAGVKEAVELSLTLPVKAEWRKHGQVIRVQVEATDNRRLPGNGADAGPQTTVSSIFRITFRDPAEIAKKENEDRDKLRARLMEMLQLQKQLNDQAISLKLDSELAATLNPIRAGQVTLRAMMDNTAETFSFTAEQRIVQKTLMILALNPAKDAVDLCTSLGTEPVALERGHLAANLQTRQRRIISTLESLLAALNAAAEPATQPTQRSHDDLLSKADAFKKLDEALKEYMKQQQKVLDQTAALAKRPVDRWDDNDKKKLEDLKMAQEKLDAFMQEKIADFSKNPDQDMSNSSMLKDLMQVYSEVTMAKDALKSKAMEIAVAAEQNGLEGAKEQSSNIEKWLMSSPDRSKWTQEELLAKNDAPLPELPKELEDMIGELMEKQEDLFDEAQDANANIADSADKGIGWDAADGPIADMSAKGVTGNQLPKNTEMTGRSGEGRQGKSQGEFVGDTAKGKGGRLTPTRLDPTPFAKGQIKDESKDSVGGATGGGKLSGQAGEGLEGPVPPKVKEQMKRLAEKQAQLRNAAERLNLKYALGRYDNFKLMESIELMRRTESDLGSNRYENALRRRDVTLDALDTSRALIGGEINVQHDSTPTLNQKTHDQINDAMKGELPPAWTDVLKQYYQKLSNE